MTALIARLSFSPVHAPPAGTEPTPLTPMKKLRSIPFLLLLVGLGLYLPYVAFHTTIFERLIALTRERANVGFLMYLADSLGYFAYAA